MQAEAVIKKMKEYHQDLPHERTRRWLLECADLLSRTQFSQRKYELAEQSCRCCIQERVVDFGIGDSRVLTCMSRLGQWLRLWNRADEALELEAWRAAGLAQPGEVWTLSSWG